MSIIGPRVPALQCVQKLSLLHPCRLDCRLYSKYRIETCIEDQAKAFMTGFNEIIPSENVKFFDSRELEVGNPSADIFHSAVFEALNPGSLTFSY